jgi:putative ABC transport system substrate-binding protein
MRRRQFITLLGGAAVGCPAMARAQKATVPVVAYLSLSFPEIESVIGAFRKGLSETGYFEGRNVAIEFLWANNDPNRLAELAADVVRRQAAVIVAAGGAASARAAKAATETIPIVFANGQDPVAMGLVAAINRPGGNVTGVTFMSTELGSKRLELLKELVPGAMLYALVVDPSAPQTAPIVAQLGAAVASIGRRIEIFHASSNREIDAAFADLVRKGAEALILGSSSLFVLRSVQIVTLAAHHHLPAIYYDRRAVEAGGLMSYGASIDNAVRQAGIYAGRILNGEKPMDLPVIQAARFQFIINLQTARTLGIEVPPSLLAFADEVIE